MKHARNKGLMTTTLIDCIAAIPCAAGSRPRAPMTKVEKAKKMPPIRPEPSADYERQCEEQVVDHVE